MPYSDSQFAAWVYNAVLFNGFIFVIDAEIYKQIIFDELTEILKDE